MTFRASSATTDTGTVLHIAGGLTREGLDVLMRAIDTADQPLIIDLSDLRHADSAAVQLLARLEAEGLPLAGVSQYLRLRLDQVADDAGSQN